MAKLKWLQKIIIPGMLILLILINLAVILPRFGSFGWGIIKNLNRDGMWRSARFAFNSNFANYIQFLREQVPADGLVVIPPENVSTWALSDTPTMEFFLYPRKVSNCTTVSCGDGQIGKVNTYILIMGLDRFPGPAIRDLPGNVRMHNDTWGVYGPAEGLGKGTLPLAWNEVFPSLRGFLLPGLMGVFFLILGFYSGSLLLPDLPAWSQLGAGSGILAGCLTVGAYLLLYFSGADRLDLIYLGLISVTVIVLMPVLIRKRMLLSSLKRLFSWGEDFDIWIIVILILGAGFAYLAAGAGFHETDSIVLWGAKARALTIDGLQGVVLRGTNTTVYPLHIPLLLGMQMDLFGDLLPASKLIFPAYYFCLLLLVYGFLKSRISPRNAGLSTLVLGTMPLIARHAMIAYANLPLSFYLITGVIIGVTAFQDHITRTRWKYWIGGGIAFALGIWTRPEGLWLAAGILLVCIAYGLRQRQNDSFQRAWIMFLIPVLWEVFWLLTRKQFYTGIDPIENSLSVLLENFALNIYHTKSLALIFQTLFEALRNIQTWAVVGAGILAGIAFAAANDSRRLGLSGLFFFSGVICLLLISGMYYVFSYDSVYDLSWWLATGYERMLMPGMTLLWLSAALIFNEPARAGGGESPSLPGRS